MAQQPPVGITTTDMRTANTEESNISYHNPNSSRTELHTHCASPLEGSHLGLKSIVSILLDSLMW